MVNDDYHKDNLYAKLHEQYSELRRAELNHRFPPEKIYADKFDYRHKNNTVIYLGKTYQRNPSSVTILSVDVAIYLKD